MAWTREQKALQREKFKQWKAKNIMSSRQRPGAKHNSGWGWKSKVRYPANAADRLKRIEGE